MYLLYNHLIWLAEMEALSLKVGWNRGLALANVKQIRQIVLCLGVALKAYFWNYNINLDYQIDKKNDS